MLIAYGDDGEFRQTPFAPLLLVVFNSILEVFLLCFAGYILAGRGILDKKTQKQLNRLNVSLFTPAFLFSKVAFFLTPGKLKELWIIPIFFLVVTGASMGVAFFLGRLFALRRSQMSFAMAAAMFMNSNSLPIALMQSLVLMVPDLQWGENDNKNAMLGRALTYLVMYSTFGMVLRWSYGVKLLSQADTEAEIRAAARGHRVDFHIADERSPLLGPFEREDPASPTNVDDSEDDTPKVLDTDSVDLTRRRLPPPMRRTTFYNSFPNSPNRSRAKLPTLCSTPVSGIGSPVALGVFSDSEDDHDDDDDDMPLPTALSAPAFPTPASRMRRAVARCTRRAAWVLAWLHDFMTVPLWAALASLVVVCIPPLQHALDHDMEPIKGAIGSAGKCSIPITLVVLGAYFYPAPVEEGAGGKDVSTQRPQKTIGAWLRGIYSKSGRSQTPREERRPQETKTVVISVVSRMIITPLLLIPAMLAVPWFHSQAVFDDPVFVVANVLLIASPPALTLAQITQAASGDAFERLISRTIFWAYCIVTPFTTIFFVLVGLMIAKM